MKAMRWTIGAGALAVLLASGAFAGGREARQPAAQAPLHATPLRPRPLAAVAPTVLLPATQALFDGYVRDNKMPGIVGAFGLGSLPTEYVQAGRISDDPGAPAAGPDSLWRVYSMTKPITALAAMILIEEGKLGLDDPLSKYFPAFAHMKVAISPDTSLDARPATRPITIRELLTHTAGLGYTIVTKGPLEKAYERAGILPMEVDAKTEPKMRAARPATLADFANRVATLPLIAEPGTKWSYSVGLDVMGAVIEQASGQPFDAFVQARIFAPLGMTSSFWQVPASEARRLATNYAFVNDVRSLLDPGATSVYLRKPSFPYGGAGLVMSARDYDRFLHLLQNGGSLDGVQIVKPQTANLMMSNLLPPGVTFTPGGGLAGGPPMGFGAGGFVTLADARGGPSKGTYGWGGAAGTIAWVDRARRFRATVMVNYFPGEQYPLRVQVGRALLADARQFAL